MCSDVYKVIKLVGYHRAALNKTSPYHDNSMTNEHAGYKEVDRAVTAGRVWENA
jgi:hypothetical protein